MRCEAPLVKRGLKPVARLDARTDKVSGAFSFDSDHGLGKRSGRDSESIAQLEQRARKAIETGAGCTFEDRDWIRMKGKLAALCAILRDWEQQTKNHPQESESSTGIGKHLMHNATYTYNRRKQSRKIRTRLAGKP